MKSLIVALIAIASLAALTTHAGAQQQVECHPNYGGCVPANQGDVDCDQVGQRVRVLGADVFGLDRDGDGVACEQFTNPVVNRTRRALPVIHDTPQASDDGPAAGPVCASNCGNSAYGLVGAVHAAPATHTAPAAAPQAAPAPAASTPQLAVTGVDSFTLALIGAAALSLGGALVAYQPARRRELT